MEWRCKNLTNLVVFKLVLKMYNLSLFHPESWHVNDDSFFSTNLIPFKFRKRRKNSNEWCSLLSSSQASGCWRNWDCQLLRSASLRASSFWCSTSFRRPSWFRISASAAPTSLSTSLLLPFKLLLQVPTTFFVASLSLCCLSMSLSTSLYFKFLLSKTFFVANLSLCYLSTRLLFKLLLSTSFLVANLSLLLLSTILVLAMLDCAPSFLMSIKYSISISYCYQRKRTYLEAFLDCAPGSLMSIE